MEKSTLIIIILIIFLFSAKSWEITWDIGKALLFIIIGIYIMNILDKDLSNKVKKILTDIINTDQDSIMDYISYISSYILNMIKPVPKVKNNKMTELNNIINKKKEETNITNNFI
jgi:hypothetical protein